MSWHIFRKDLVLLWPLVALSALAQFGLNALMFTADQMPDSRYLMIAGRLFVLVVFLAIALTISLGVHQDTIPGTRQDWLIRPIRRRDMVLAKLLFVIVAIQLPMFLADLLELLSHGFALKETAAAALTRNLIVFIALSLPALAFAAITRSTAQFIGVGIAYFIAISAATFLLSTVARIGGAEQATNPLVWTGVAWVPQFLARLALAAGALLALLLSYIGRRVTLARSLFPIFAAMSALTTLLPWGSIFAIEEAVASSPDAVDALSVSIDPAAPQYRLARDEVLDDYVAGAAQVQLRGRAVDDIEVENRTRHVQGDVTVLIPIRITGLPIGGLPWVDRATIVLRARDGRILFEGRGDDLKFDETQTRSPAAVAYEAVRIPGLVYENAKDTPLSAEIDYWLSVLRPRQAVAIPALGARMQVPGFGQCTTDRDSDGNDVEMHCLKADDAPSCVAVTLDDPVTGHRNPETRICAPDYSPYTAKLFPDAGNRFEVEAPFRDRLQRVTYPVGGADLGRARLVLTRYDASEHISRHLTAAQVRLSAWIPNSAIESDSRTSQGLR